MLYLASRLTPAGVVIGFMGATYLSSFSAIEKRQLWKEELLQSWMRKKILLRRLEC